MTFLPSTVPTFYEVAAMRARIAELEAELALVRSESGLRGSLLSATDPIPFLPVDPEEQRRMDTVASDGRQAMIYRRPS